MSSTTDTAQRTAWAALANIVDPEIPSLPITDLGIVRAVEVDADDSRTVEVTITPTYSGCPALDVIEQAIGDALGREFDVVRVRTQLAPPWSTDMISERGLELLQAAGIAPPRPVAAPAGAMVSMRGTLPLADADPPVACPYCGAADTERLAEFGSTACKSLWRCCSCREPFDRFKPLAAGDDAQ